MYQKDKKTSSMSINAVAHGQKTKYFWHFHSLFRTRVQNFHKHTRQAHSKVKRVFVSRQYRAHLSSQYTVYSVEDMHFVFSKFKTTPRTQNGQFYYITGWPKTGTVFVRLNFAKC